MQTCGCDARVASAAPALGMRPEAFPLGALLMYSCQGGVHKFSRHAACSIWLCTGKTFRWLAGCVHFTLGMIGDSTRSYLLALVSCCSYQQLINAQRRCHRLCAADANAACKDPKEWLAVPMQLLCMAKTRCQGAHVSNDSAACVRMLHGCEVDICKQCVLCVAVAKALVMACPRYNIVDPCR